MKQWYFKLFSWSVFIEWKGCTRGQTYIDYMKEVHIIHVWIGALYVLLESKLEGRTNEFDDESG